MLRSSAQIATAVTWANLPDKPATFPPSPHTHAFGDLTGIPATFPPAVHTHAWADITGKPSTFTPAAHTHSYNDLTDKPVIPPATGRLVLIGTVNVAETLLVSLAVGMKRKAFTLQGVSATDLLVAVPTGTPTAGCEVVNAYPAGANSVSVGYYTPLLAIGAAYSIPVGIYRIT
ncbi:hypothetical protein GCM10011380_00590 [Sphingomonas metalli]|uniref:Uncharacterized protein n=1 Tax=Sphingomonas metalli TaxID=1779358 RepID=A0A916SV69_9SPHN|nr:hypothetical protein [Sphingomonas metalli]GGB15056.1 hypothetical protein GCM10011380_00590 [Sphingomonas metalli]